MASAIALKYYNLIKAGEKTIDQVPFSKRTEVRELLDADKPTTLPENNIDYSQPQVTNSY